MKKVTRVHIFLTVSLQRTLAGHVRGDDYFYPVCVTSLSPHTDDETQLPGEATLNLQKDLRMTVFHYSTPALVLFFLLFCHKNEKQQKYSGA